MLEKPALKGERILACLAQNYNVHVTLLVFLPWGADRNTIVYRALADDQAVYFVKLRRDDFSEASVLVPKQLSKQGIRQVIAPYSTREGQLWAHCDAYRLILYPFVKGQNGFQIALSAQQRVELGMVLKQLHTVSISDTLAASVPREEFSAEWRTKVKRFLSRFEYESFHDPITQAMATFLNGKRDELRDLIKHVEQLLERLQIHPQAYVLCHADIHGWNMLIEETGAFYVVDWDTLLFAPKERDLMFVGCGLGGRGQTLTEETALFYQGYGQVPVNQVAIAYYRYERIIQDIAEYCEQILESEGEGEDRVWAIETLKANFAPKNVLDLARQLDQT